MRRARAGGQCARRDANTNALARSAPPGDPRRSETKKPFSRLAGEEGCVVSRPPTRACVFRPSSRRVGRRPRRGEARRDGRSIDRVGPTGLVVYESRPVIVQNETKEEKNRPTVRRIDGRIDGSTDRPTGGHPRSTRTRVVESPSRRVVE